MTSDKGLAMTPPHLSLTNMQSIEFNSFFCLVEMILVTMRKMLVVKQFKLATSYKG
jgi:hypothetical protein